MPPAVPARRRPLRALLWLALACSAVLLAAAPVAAAETASCSRFAAPGGSDAASGTEVQPLRTAQRLVDSLSPGETGCLRSGSYSQSVTITRGGLAGQPVTLRSYPGERVTLTGRLVVRKGADFVTVQDLWLDGRNASNLPSPTVNANDVTFRHNDVTNAHTAICFVLGASNVDSSAAYGRAAGTLLDGNRIHDCGKLPATNHDHGVYVEGADDVRIQNNWIYDNADRGIQLYPDAQRTTIVGNVLDGNGTNLIFSGDLGVASNGNSVTGNVISRAKLRFNVESWYPDGNPRGTNNTVTSNCIHGAARSDFGVSGINTADGGFTAGVNTIQAPAYVDAAAHDYRLTSTSPCLTTYRGAATVPGPRLDLAVPPATEPPPATQPPATQPATEPPPVTIPPPASDPAPTTDPAPTADPAPAPAPTGRKKPRPRGRVSLTVAARTSIRPVVHHGRSLGLVGTVQAALMPRRVLIQARRHGHWRLVARARPNRSGRFSIRWRVKARRTRTVRLRAVAPGVARSRPLVIALARR